LDVPTKGRVSGDADNGFGRLARRNSTKRPALVREGTRLSLRGIPGGYCGKQDWLLRNPPIEQPLQDVMYIDHFTTSTMQDPEGNTKNKDMNGCSTSQV